MSTVGSLVPVAPGYAVEHASQARRRLLALVAGLVMAAFAAAFFVGGAVKHSTSPSASGVSLLPSSAASPTPAHITPIVAAPALPDLKPVPQPRSHSTGGGTIATLTTSSQTYTGPNLTGAGTGTTGSGSGTSGAGTGSGSGSHSGTPGGTSDGGSSSTTHTSTGSGGGGGAPTGGTSG